MQDGHIHNCSLELRNLLQRNVTTFLKKENDIKGVSMV